MNTPANTAGLLQKKQQEAQAPTPVKQMTPQEIARAKMKNTIKASLPQFTSALPKAIKPERFQSMVLTAVNTNPKLMACDPLSVVASALQSAQLGLEPNTPLGQAYLIPYDERKLINGTWQTVRTVCNFQVGYRGLITLAFRSGELQCLDAQEVYANDEFDFEYGLNMTLKHIPATHNRKQPGENPTHYYAVYKLKNGGQGMAVMTYEDVLEHAKKFSKTYSKKTGKFSGPWADNFDAMAKKTVLLKLMKYMPMAADSPLAKATTVDGSQFTGAISEDKTPEFEFAPIDVEALELNNDSAEPIESDPETGEINE